MKKSAKTNKKSIRKQMATTQAVKLILAGYLLVLLLLQLFAFEKVPLMIIGAGVPALWANILAIGIVSAELLALPFLIGLKLPKGLHIISCVSVFVSLALMAAVEFIMFLSGGTVLFGAVFDLPGGSWSLLFIAALVVLAIWGALGGSMGSTPVKTSKKSSK